LAYYQGTSLLTTGRHSSQILPHILYFTGIATMLRLLQYFAPKLVLSMSAMKVSDAAGLLLASASCGDLA
jgi:hypothetical protein